MKEKGKDVKEKRKNQMGGDQPHREQEERERRRRKQRSKEEHKGQITVNCELV